MEVEGKLSSDEDHPRLAAEVLPVEVWNMILLHVSGDAESMDACYRSCQLMEGLLAPRKSEFEFMRVFPCINRYLDNESIRTCRLVCKTWKNVIDKTFADEVPEHFYNLFTSNPYALGNIDDTSPFKYRFADFHQIRLFTTQMLPLGPSANPFISKCVIFSDEDEDHQAASAEMWEHLTNQFLPVFGRFINSCKFEFGTRWNYGPRLVHVILIAALRSLPHLRNLSIDFRFTPEIPDYLLEHFVPPFQVVETDLPELTELRTLCMPKLGFESTQWLLKECIEELTVDMNFFHNFPMVNMSNLRVLSTCGSYANTHILAKFSNVRLTKMKVRMNSVMGFKTAEVFKDTLEELEVEIIFPREVECMEYRVDLPQLKRLQLAFPVNMYFYDFLLSLHRLEYLTITQTKRSTYFFDSHISQELRTLQIKDYEERLSDSNVWELLPSLNKVCIRSSSFNYCHYRVITL